MASVTYRKRGKRWEIRFRAPGKSEIPKTYPGSLQERTIEDKVAWFKEQIALDRYDPWEERRKQQREERYRLKLSRAVGKYIDWGLNEARWKKDAKGKSKTADTNKKRLGWMVDGLGNISVNELDPEEIKYWLVNKQKLQRKGKKWIPTGETISPVTMKSWKITINSFLRWLNQKGYLQDLRQVYLPKQITDQARDIIKQPSGISLNKVLLFCQAASQRVSRSAKNKHYHRSDSMDWIVSCAQLAFWTMLRHDELLHLYPEDFSEDLEYITIGFPGSSTRPKFVPKSGIETLPLLKPAQEVIRRFKLHEKPKGEPLFKVSYDYMNVAFRRICKEAFEGELFPPHTFRHGGIMHLRSILQEPGLVTKLARHSSQEVTERIYGGVDPVYLKRAVDRVPLKGVKIFN